MLARYGGEEFVGLWVGVSQAAMLALAERIRADVEALALAHAQSAEAQVVTLSIGVAYWPSPQVNGLEEAQRLADEALYAAKAAGRNRVVVRLGQPLWGVLPWSSGYYRRHEYDPSPLSDCCRGG